MILWIKNPPLSYYSTCPAEHAEQRFGFSVILWIKNPPLSNYSTCPSEHVEQRFGFSLILWIKNPFYLSFDMPCGTCRTAFWLFYDFMD